MSRPASGTDLPPVFHIETARTARVSHLGPPGAPTFWIVLHGYRQLAPWFLRRFRGLDDGSRQILAPEALNRFYAGDPDGRHGPETRVGATWMTRVDRERDIADYVGFLDRVAEVAGGSARPYVFGFSQGAHTAARWCLAGRVVPSAVVLWGEGLPHDVDEAGLVARRHRWILVRGVEDRTRDPSRERRDADLLEGAGADWEIIEHSGGHRVEPAELHDIVARIEGQPPTKPISGSSS